MFLGIKYLGSNGQDKQFTVRKQEEVTFGSSRRADYVIDSESGISDVHFVVAYRDNDWQIAGYGPNSFKHNGHNVIRCALTHGDRIIAGRAEFEIVIQSGPETMVADPAEISPATAEEVQPERIEIVTTYKGVISKAEVLSISELPSLISSMGQMRSLYLLFNRKRFGVQDVFGSVIVAQDLIENAPREIGSTDSLELIADAGGIANLRDVERILTSDSGVLLASSKNEVDLKESMKLVWGWFLRPSVLNHHLEHGSEFLTTQLLSSVDTLLIMPKHSGRWTFWGKTEAQSGFMSELVKANPLIALS